MTANTGNSPDYKTTARDTYNNVKETTMNNSSIIIRTATVILSLGIIGYVLWNMPILEMLFLFFYAMIVPAVFLTAMGIVGWETFSIMWKGAGYFRCKVNAYLADMKTDAVTS